MARTKKEVEETEEEVEEVKSSKDDAIVVDSNGEYVRTYEKEVHGKDFEKLANAFAKKIGGKVK